MNNNGKLVLNMDNLCGIFLFDTAFDSSILPGERRCIQPAGCYSLFCYTEAQPAELMNDERNKLKNSSTEETLRYNDS